MFIKSIGVYEWYCSNGWSVRIGGGGRLGRGKIRFGRVGSIARTRGASCAPTSEKAQEGGIGHRLGRGGGEKQHPLKPEGAAPRRRVRGNLSLASLEWVWESEAIVGVGGGVK
jgi:hypothetical protein